MVDGRVVGGKCLQLRLRHLTGRVLVLELHQLHLGGGGRALGGGRHGVHVWGIVGDGGFGPFFLSNLVGDVGAGQGTTVDTQAPANGLGEEADPLLTDIDALDAGDTAGVGQDLPLDRFTCLVDELVRQVEDEQSAVLDRVLQGRVGVQVGGQANSWKIFHVLVCAVNHVGQLVCALQIRAIVRGVLGDLDVLLKHPHFDLLLKDVRVAGGIFGDDLGDGGTPKRSWISLVNPAIAERERVCVCG